MIKTRDKDAELNGKVKTVMSNSFPEGMNMGIRIKEKGMGEDIEIYINPNKIYNTLMFRKHMLGALNLTFQTLIKTMMDKILMVNEKGTYLNKINVNGSNELKEINTQVNILKSELEFGNQEKANHLYAQLDNVMKKMEIMIEDIIIAREIEESKLVQNGN